MSNPERKLILDLSAIEEERGQHPNDYFVCLTRNEAAAAAVAIAHDLNSPVCTDRECLACNEVRRLFWNIVNELGPRLQRAVFTSLEITGTPLPDGPWEEVRA